MEDMVRHIREVTELNSSRIAVLETTTKSTDVCLHRLVKESDNIRESVHRIEVMQAQRASVPLCVAPNKCLELEKQMIELTKSVQMLIEAKAETRGGLRVMMAIAAIGGSVGGAALSYVLHLITGIKHP